MNIVLVLVCGLLCFASAGKGRKKARGPDTLLHSLMRDYSNLYRPNNGANATVIKFGVDLNDVVNLREGTLEATVSFRTNVRMVWTDPRLQWDPDQHDIRQIRLEPSRLWTPDIKLINGLDPTPDIAVNGNLLVNFDGTINARLPMVMMVHCGRPNRDPHASWECLLKFRSWTYSVDDLNVVLDSEIANDMSYNERVWRITLNDAKRMIVKEDCCPERYAMLQYAIRLIRH